MTSLLNPWLIIGALATLIATGAGGFFYGNHVGTVSTENKYQGQQIAELKVANAEIDRLNKVNRGLEATQATALAVQGADYEKRLQDAEGQRRSDVAAARAGRIVLRVPGACAGPNAGSTPAAAAAPGQRDDPTTGQLPAATTADLLELADDADRTVEQLSACQSVITTYLKGQP
jgi:hypothetical protein